MVEADCDPAGDAAAVRALRAAGPAPGGGVHCEPRVPRAGLRRVGAGGRLAQLPDLLPRLLGEVRLQQRHRGGTGERDATA